ncbi:DNA cytosine methyltransferase [Hyalangium rubrum]|uniref:DNA (cytosine-5-)-methyltransferase n=1 Tax=Hyalangium rubrum TaxID=3103134 RepID=A0ABU5H6C7_9BACT|nr:DNA cytosine methyltransferase [Hyalangium sp. s54d21]MDY7229025.1 DNA cytosine methyltransferase [Hyalangium sp. s54d21]
MVDLFAGCGAMSLGLKCAAEALGLDFVPLLVADANVEILDIYEHNLNPLQRFDGDLSQVVQFDSNEGSEQGGFRKQPALLEQRFSSLGKVDVLIGGPPCQGHSDLNNHSRRNDPKNALYLLMPAIAACLSPRAIIIENVRSVVHDKSRVVQRTKSLLEGMGYHVDDGLVLASEVGVPQLRRRHFLLATRERKVRVSDVVSAFRTAPRPIGWAIEDLLDVAENDVIDTPSKLSAINQKRVDWLFKHKKDDLPDELRPSCHKDKPHSYKSMYGRMKWSEPAQTITSGFGSPGQGRFIHPRQRRLITPHEAARLQFIPDSFQFSGKNGFPKRTRLAEMIGNAVPPKLAYVMGLGAMSAFL